MLKVSRNAEGKDKDMINKDYGGVATHKVQGHGQAGTAKGQMATQSKGHAFNRSPFEPGEVKNGVLSLVMQLLARLQKNGRADPQLPPPVALNLSATEEGRLKQLLGFTEGAPVGVELLDVNRDGIISAGDVAVVSGGITGGEIRRHTLTDQDVKSIQATNTVPQDFNANRVKWKDANSQPHNGLSYTTQSSCFCPQDYTRPMNVTEQNGRIVSATYADAQGGAVPDYVRDALLPIEERFQQLRDAYTNGAERVDVTYDPTYGYPTSVYIDRSSMMADEEISFSVKGLQFNV